uniref:hypothetical protein n=1 Tax=uncultured Intestinimonas sp. TaxID=1689265 RepID=UPI0025E9A4C5
TISYTPGTNPIQDEAGNQADSLSGESVTNNTPSASTALTSLAVTVTADENYSATIAVSGNTGSVKYAVVTDDPSAIVTGWTTNTTAEDALAELGAESWQDSAPTLGFADNDQYVIAVEVAERKLVAAGSCLISGIESPYTFDDSSITEAVEGGAGVSQTISFAGSGVAFTGNEYVVVQITTGSGEDIQNTMVMMVVQTGTESVTISYDSDATGVTVWLASDMPNLISADGTGVTSYDTCTVK